MEYNTRTETGTNGPVFLTLPDFATFDPDQALAELKALFASGRRLMNKTAKAKRHTFASLVMVFEEHGEALQRVYGPLAHLDSAMQTERVRNAHNKAVELYSDYGSDGSLHEGLYRAHVEYKKGDEYPTLTAEQRKIVDDAIEDFELAGVALPPEKKVELKTLNRKAARLSTRFKNNVLASTKAWTKHVPDESHLSGLPPVLIETMRSAARERKLDGFVVTLQPSIVTGVLTYAENRDLRKELYIARNTTASDVGPGGKKCDNRPVMKEILRVAGERARLLGYRNYAELSLRKKMAKTPERAFTLMNELAAKSHKRAHDEFAELAAFAKEKLGIASLEPWDVGYASEKLLVAEGGISQEELRPYFTATKVFDGLFRLIEKLYGLTVKEVTGVEKPSVWDPSVRFFRVLDKGGRLRATFYADLYERLGEEGQKRAGAWADGCMNRRALPNGTQVPCAYFVCNFAAPVGGKEGQLTHDDVTTVFHEFGHDLHHMLGLPDYASSNWGRVEWDAIELPSQFMENYCWNKEMLRSLSAHVDSGATIPDALCDRLIASKHFHAGLAMARQLEFGLVDMALYSADDPDINAIDEGVRKRVRVTPVYEHDRFLNAFQHIFAGGYAAGYYSYKWAEVLAADAFEAFEETGNIYDSAVGAKFLHEVLEASGKRPIEESYVAFRGRLPAVDALLRQSGLLAK